VEITNYLICDFHESVNGLVRAVHDNLQKKIKKHKGKTTLNYTKLLTACYYRTQTTEYRAT